MGDLIELNDRLQKAQARTFVDKYIKDGRIAAGKWAMQLTSAQRKALKPYVRSEFQARGYEYDTSN